MELADVPDFLAAFRERSLTRAAGRQGVNQSTMSRRLASLEARAGHLFDRVPEGLKPTPLANRLFPMAERVEAEAMALRRALSQPVLVEGVVRVAVAEAVAVYLILPKLPALRAAYPALHLDLVVGESLADLQHGEADIAVRHVPTSRGDLTTRLVAHTRFAPLAHEGLAATLGDDPATWPWIGVSHHFAHLPEYRWYERYIGVPPVLRTNGYVARHEALRQGLGVALVSRALAGHFGLVALTTGLPDCEPGPVWLVTHRELRDVPRVVAVWDFLLGALAAT